MSLRVRAVLFKFTYQICTEWTVAGPCLKWMFMWQNIEAVHRLHKQRDAIFISLLIFGFRGRIVSLLCSHVKYNSKPDAICVCMNVEWVTKGKWSKTKQTKHKNRTGTGRSRALGGGTERWKGQPDELWTLCSDHDFILMYEAPTYYFHRDNYYFWILLVSDK